MNKNIFYQHFNIYDLFVKYVIFLTTKMNNDQVETYNNKRQQTNKYPIYIIRIHMK